MPDGYELENQIIGRQLIQYVFVDSEGHKIKFIQQSLDASNFYVDVENSDNVITEIGEYTVYSRKTNNMYYYLWNNGNYALILNSTEELSIDTLELIINGIKIK